MLVLLLQLILKNTVSIRPIQIVGDMESISGDGSNNTAEKMPQGQ
jgi:hypothetical protein